MSSQFDSEKFGRFTRIRRVWAVGAIHGEATKLEALHEQLARKIQTGDKLAYLGNFMGWGQTVLRTIDELLLFRRQLLAVPRMHNCDIAYLRGQQEEMWHKMLQLHLAVGPAEVLEWMLEQGLRATLKAYGGDENMALRQARSGSLGLARWTNQLRQNIQAHEGHVQLMSVLKRAVFSDDGNLLFVNSGINLERPLDAQGDAFWWHSQGFDSLEAPFSGYKRVIRGFDSAHGGIKISPYSATIDSACGFGGMLTAICFDSHGQEIERIEA